MNPLVSIIMPVYNGAPYLRHAVDSILNQNFSDFELIIVNDGSTDDSEKIVRSYSDDRIVLVSQVNQGVATALNNGLKIARGKYIRRHDADDISLAEDLQVQVDFLERHPEFALVSCQIIYMTDRGKKARRYRNPNPGFFAGQPYVEVDHEMYARFRPVIHATVLMRRDVVIDLGGYRKEFLTSEDIDLWLRFLDHHRIAVLNQAHYYVRLHHSSATRKHAGTVDFYRDLAFCYARQRRDYGMDDLEAGKSIPLPVTHASAIPEQALIPGKICRDDLNFYYNILLDAKDTVNLGKTLRTMVRDGWQVPNTWKMILFPILGQRFTRAGVIVKSWFNS